MSKLYDQASARLAGESLANREERHRLLVNPNIIRVRNELVNRVIRDYQTYRAVRERAFDFEDAIIELKLSGSDGFKVDFFSIPKDRGPQTGFTFYTEAIHGRDYREVPLSRIDVRCSATDAEIRMRTIGAAARRLGAFAEHYMTSEMNRWDTLIGGEYPDFYKRGTIYVAPPPGTRRIIDVETDISTVSRRLADPMRRMRDEDRLKLENILERLKDERAKRIERRRIIFGKAVDFEPEEVSTAIVPPEGPILMVITLGEHAPVMVDMRPAFDALDAELIGELFDPNTDNSAALWAVYEELLSLKTEVIEELNRLMLTDGARRGHIERPNLELENHDQLRSWVRAMRPEIAGVAGRKMAV